MKHFRILLPLLILALILSGCGKQSMEPYTYTIHTNSGEKTINIYPESGQIVDGLDVYTYTVEESAGNRNYVITYPNGNRFFWVETKNGGHGGWSVGSDNVRYISANLLVNALEVNQPRQKVGSVGIGLLLMGLGALNFFLPELPFYLKYGWAVENAEPSEAYITSTKICGVIFAAAGLIACFI